MRCSMWKMITEIAKRWHAQQFCINPKMNVFVIMDENKKKRKNEEIVSEWVREWVGMATAHHRMNGIKYAAVNEHIKSKRSFYFSLLSFSICKQIFANVLILIWSASEYFYFVTFPNFHSTNMLHTQRHIRSSNSPPNRIKNP